MVDPGLVDDALPVVWIAADGGVDLDELVGVAEQIDPEECRRWYRCREPVGDGPPCVEQVLVFTDDVDGEVSDVGEVEVVDADQCPEVVEACRCLSGGIASTDEVAVAVEGT